MAIIITTTIIIIAIVIMIIVTITTTTATATVTMTVTTTAITAPATAATVIAANILGTTIMQTPGPKKSLTRPSTTGSFRLPLMAICKGASAE